MKNNIHKTAFISIAFVAATGATFAADTAVSQKEYTLPHCDAPVASVVVGNLTCKAAGCQAAGSDPTGLAALIRMSNGDAEQSNFANIGEGMSAMLTTVLKATGCFDIQEREAMEELAKELALVGKKVEVQQADFMISGSITSINMSTSKAAIGGGYIPIIGMLSVTTKTADVGVDIKLIDVNRAKVVDSKTFVANNESTSTSLGGMGFGGGGALIGGLSSIKGTPMEPIVREVLAQVATFTANKLVSIKAPTLLVPAPVAPVAAPVSAAPATVAVAQ